jgi:thiamine monophosphate kinase
LGDGEDFELLFSVDSGHAVALLDAWKKQFPKLRLSCIGRITTERGLKLRDKTGLHSLETHGYVHFA